VPRGISPVTAWRLTSRGDTASAGQEAVHSAQDQSAGTGGWGRSILSHLLQPVSALDEFYQSFHETRCWCAVYDIVVEGDRQVEHVAGFDTLRPPSRGRGTSAVAKDRCVQLVTALVLPTTGPSRYGRFCGGSPRSATPSRAIHRSPCWPGWMTALTGQTAEAQRLGGGRRGHFVRRRAIGRLGVVRLGAGNVADGHVCRRSRTSNDRRELRCRPRAAMERLARRGALAVRNGASAHWRC
jgi:hypothetical protein